MSQLPARNLTPEAEELERKRSELEQLEHELSERELELTTLKAELAVFERRYLEVVGRRYAELDRIEAEIAEVLAREHPADDSAQAAAQAARETASDSAQAVDGSADDFAQKDFKPSEDLKRLYRQVAVRMHPDLTTDPAEKERRHRYMVELNRAYSEGAEERIRELLREWESSPDSVAGDGPGAELVRVIRKIDQVRSRLQSIEKELQGVRESDLFDLKTRVEEGEHGQRNVLQEMAERVDAEIASARRRWNQLAESHSDE